MPNPTPDELSELPLFSDLTDDERATISGWMEAETHPQGHAIVHQGASGYAFFVLAAGAADVTVDGVAVRRLEPGDFFGEMSILGDGRRSATVTAASESTVWSMFGTRFREFQQSEPRIAQIIEDAAVARHDSDTERLK